MSTASFPYQPLDILGYTLHDRRFPKEGAQPVILIHGVGVSGRYYESFARELAQDYSVYVPDLPGYGKTPKPPAPLAIPELARILREYIRTTGIEKPVLVGHSMGCQIVAHAWRQEPDICDKLILLGPTVNPRERSLTMQALRLFEDTLHEPPSANVIVFGDYLRMGPARYVQTSRNMVRDHLEDTLTGCTIPLLLVRGERDKIVPRDWLDTLAQVVPQAQIYEMPGQPHIVQYQHAQELAAICRPFING